MKNLKKITLLAFVVTMSFGSAFGMNKPLANGLVFGACLNRQEVQKMSPSDLSKLESKFRAAIINFVVQTGFYYNHEVFKKLSKSIISIFDKKEDAEYRTKVLQLAGFDDFKKKVLELKDDEAMKKALLEWKFVVPGEEVCSNVVCEEVIFSPFELALMCERLEIAKFLIENGAGVKANIRESSLEFIKLETLEEMLEWLEGCK